MGRFDAKYSDEQREAVINAITADGVTAREAIELAAAGDLGVPAFDMAESTARGLVSRAGKRRRQATVLQHERDEPGRGTAILDRCLTLLEDELGQLEERVRSDGELDDKGLHRVRGVARAYREVDKMRIAIDQQARARQSAKPAAEPGSDDSSVIEDMLNAHNGTKGNGAQGADVE